MVAGGHGLLMCSSMQFLPVEFPLQTEGGKKNKEELTSFTNPDFPHISLVFKAEFTHN